MKWKLILIILLLIPIVNAQDQFICQKIYYFILNGENNITLLQEEISSKYNLNTEEIKNMIKNYTEICYEKGYSDQLPRNLNILVINKSTQDICNENINSEFFNYYIPIPEINIGNIDCDSINNFKWIINFKYSENYTINGVKIWFILLIVFSLLSYKLIKINKRIKRLR